MAVRTADELKSFFETGDTPTESQFGDLIDSIFNAGSSDLVGDILSIGNITSYNNIVPISKGGSNTSTQVNNGITYFDGTKITSSINFITNNASVSIGGALNANPLLGDVPHIFEVVSDNANLSNLRFSTYGPTPGGQNNCHWGRMGGSLASPSATQNGMYFMSMGFRGYGSTAATGSSLAFQALATENWTDAANGAAFKWQTTPNGTVARQQSLFLNGNGQLLVGQQISPVLGGNQMLDIQNNSNAFAKSVISNTTSGTGAGSAISLYNDLSEGLNLFNLSSGYTGAGILQPNTGVLYTDSVNGLNLGAIGGTGKMNFFTGANNTSNIRMSIDASGRIAIGTSPANGYAILDLQSTLYAFLPPRMTSTQRDAIVTPTAGMIVYNTTTNLINFYNSAWTALGGVSTISISSTNGFTGTSSGGNTPILTLTTNINSPILAGNGTALVAATVTGTGSIAVLNNTPTLLTPIFTGLPTGTGVASSATVSTLVARDASGNINGATIFGTKVQTGTGTITNKPAYIHLYDANDTASSIAAYSNDKGILLYTNGTIAKLDAFDFGNNIPFNLAIGGNGGAVTLDAVTNVTGTLTVKHLKGGTTSPTSAIGAGAGTSPGAITFLNATDIAGKVLVTTGSAPPTLSTILTIIFNSTYSSAPTVILTPANDAAATANIAFVSSTSTTGFTIQSSSSGLIAATAYAWWYQVIQ